MLFSHSCPFLGLSSGVSALGVWWELRESANGKDPLHLHVVVQSGLQFNFILSIATSLVNTHARIHRSNQCNCCLCKKSMTNFSCQGLRKKVLKMRIIFPTITIGMDRYSVNTYYNRLSMPIVTA